MRVLVTGAKGLLGTEFVSLFEQSEVDHIGVDLDELDITDAVAVEKMISEERPEFVINCAAYTAVDRAEVEEEIAVRVNGEGAGHVAKAAAKFSSLMVHFSTDFIFDGESQTPYLPDDLPRPQSAYGRSKLIGERAVLVAGGDHLIIRTSWLYGAAGPNFVSSILNRVSKGEALKVVDDQTGSPSWARNVAEVTWDLIRAGARGIHHVTDSGETTWFGFAKRVLAIRGLTVSISGLSAREWGAPAPRPVYSVLDLSSTETLLGRRLEPWQSALSRFLEESQS